MEKDYKLIVVWNRANGLSSFTLSRKRVITILSIAFVCFFLIVGLSVYYLSEFVYYARLESIKKSNQKLLRTFYELKERMRLLESELSTLVEKDKALRTYADVPQIDLDIRKLGIGGRRYYKVKELDILFPDSLKVSELVHDIDRLGRLIKLEKVSYENIYKAFQLRSRQIRSTPTFRPTMRGYITDGFGYRIDPFTGKRQFHYGVDISAPIGTKVYATGDGVVTVTRYSKTYGKVIKIDHGFGYSTIYAHLSRIYVKEGDVVRRGEVIGEVGCTGRSTAPHLHYEIRQFGIAKNPLDYFFAAIY